MSENYPMIHNLLDLLRATEAAAIYASQWVGTGDKESADKAATDAMRDRLNGLDFSGIIKIGDGPAVISAPRANFHPRHFWACGRCGAI